MLELLVLLLKPFDSLRRRFGRPAAGARWFVAPVHRAGPPQARRKHAGSRAGYVSVQEAARESGQVR
ncbi:hypothetical protein AB0H69_46365 [Streptomyces phaeochromogenes]|uniref:hypothetical protein n=1 Tax=Streptomyces phaeochromogenes TaxID=1923 RepID=UPI0033CC5C39